MLRAVPIGVAGIAALLTLTAPAANADAVYCVPGAWIEPPAGMQLDWDNDTMNPRIGEGWYTSDATPTVINYHRNPVLSVDNNVADGQQKLHGQVLAQLADDPNGHITITSLSQGTIVANEEKRALMDAGVPGDQVTIIETGSPYRGLASKLPEGTFVPGVNYTVTRPVESPYEVIVVNGEYDGWADPPDRMWNVVADANAIMGSQYVHSPTALSKREDAVQLSRDTNTKGGTTTTYLVPTKNLPLTQPLRDLGVDTKVIDKPLRAIVDAGYKRNDHKTQAKVSATVKKLQGIGDKVSKAVRDAVKPAAKPAQKGGEE